MQRNYVTFRIHIEWQLEVTTKCGHDNVLSIDVAFGTNHSYDTSLHVCFITFIGFHVMCCHSMSLHYSTSLIRD